MSDEVLIGGIFLLVVLFAGEPDIADGIIAYLQSGGC